MDALLFIAIPAANGLDETTPLIWFHQSEEKNTHGCDTASHLKKLFPDSICIGVLSGEQVFETQSELRIKNRKQLEQALSYDLEEQLAVEVDTLHFAYQKNAEKKLNINVIDKAYLEQLIQFFSEQDILLQQLISETSLLSQASEEWLIIHNHQQCLLKSGKYSYTLETENLLLSLEALPEELQFPETISVYTTGSFNLESSLTQFSCKTISHYFSEICQYYPSTPLLNLLQGSYQVKTAQTWRLIIIASIAGILLFSSLCFYQLYQNQQLQKQESSLENKIILIYKKSFPSARRIINPISQMRSKLKKLKQKQVKNGDFLPLLAKLARTIRQQNSFELNQLNFQKQTLSISFSVLSLEKLEHFKKNLIQLGLQADVTSVNKEENKVNANITISRGHL